MIKLVNICKTYHSGKSNEIIALNSLNLEIKKGEMIAIMGTSGSGKSTLINILSCTIGFDSGTYYFNDKNIGELSDKELAFLRNKQIGVVHQDFQLLTENTVYENIEIPLLFSKIRKKERKALCEKALSLVNIMDLKDKTVNTLSGGQKQRVSIARAIVNSPSLILADEPTGSLDSKKSNEIMSLLQEINSNNTTIVVVTHDKQIAQKCHRIVNILDGKID